MNLPSAKEVFTSIIEWTDADELPHIEDSGDKVDYLRRRLMLIRNAARLGETLPAGWPNSKSSDDSADAELMTVITGLHNALSDMIDRHDPDSRHAEWLSHSSELVNNLGGQLATGHGGRRLIGGNKV